MKFPSTSGHPPSSPTPYPLSLLGKTLGAGGGGGSRGGRGEDGERGGSEGFITSRSPYFLPPLPTPKGAREGKEENPQGIPPKARSPDLR